MKYFKSESGEVFAYESDGSQDEWILPSLVAMSADEIDQHMNPQPTFDEIKGLIAARRYQAEVGGITINDVFVDTGRDSQALITGAALSAMLDSTYVCRWKTPAGFVSLDATSLIAIAQQVRAHVQACFDREEDLLIAVAGSSYTDAMLQEGWPI